MKELLEKAKSSTLHSRLIDLRTYAVDKNRVIVEGRLTDQRFRPIYDIDGKKKEPGPIHEMVICLLVENRVPFTILDAQAEMLHFPHELCPQTLSSIKRLVGIEVKSGFGQQVRELMGGTKGCAHLTHLMMTMGQEIFAGSMTHRLREPRPLPCAVEDIKGLEYLVNSCWVWREGGPLVQRVQEVVKRQECL